MTVAIRPATPDDRGVAALLHASAVPFYDRYAGGPDRARRLLDRAFPRPGHAASFQACRVAEVDGRVVGVVAAFPAARADALSRRFIALTAPRVPPWRWPGLVRGLWAAGRLVPRPPADAWYVDALAVAPEARHQGIARRLLADAEERAREVGAPAVALDTTIENAAARGLYVSAGFTPGPELRASPRAAALLGIEGFVPFVRWL